MVVGLSAPEGSEFRVQVQDYSGPLDLFVYLVKQEELDLLAVSVLRIVKGLAKFISKQSPSLDSAGEAMLLTADLVYLKSCLLLPGTPGEEAQDDLPEPSSVLVQRILQYEEARAMAQGLSEQQERRRALWFSGDSSKYSETEENDIVGASVVDLALSFMGMLTRDEVNQVQYISRERYSIAETVMKMVQILKGKPSVSMREVFSQAQDLEEKLAFFLALLELVKFSLVAALQRRNSFNIRLKLLADADVEQLRLKLAVGPQSGSHKLAPV
ncbi:MAG TPA: segregation/condensation protein A [bacterium]|nr:segregation/condensation protein A [bacterium]